MISLERVIILYVECEVHVTESCDSSHYVFCSAHVYDLHCLSYVICIVTFIFTGVFCSPHPFLLVSLFGFFIYISPYIKFYLGFSFLWIAVEVKGRWCIGLTSLPPSCAD